MNKSIFMTRSILISLQFLFASCLLSAQPTHLVEQFMKGNFIPGMFIGVVKGDSVIYRQSFGAANIKNGIPVTDTVCMELGSISKAFTAEVIYQLKDAGLLNTKDLVRKYLPEAPSSWSKIRIEHLLKHISGIQNYLLDPRFMAADYFTNSNDPAAVEFFNTISTDSMIKLFYSLPLEFPPGYTWSYSNTGYYLLGKICEKVSGKPFFQLAKEFVTEPLHMSSTKANETSATEGCLARGYFLKDSVLTTAPVLTSRYAYAAGAWATTGQDMIRYMKAMHQRRLPSDKAEIEWRDPPRGNKLPFTYADGHFYATFHGQNIISHNGGTPGFSSSWIYAVDLNTSVIVLMNRQDYALVDQLAWDILSWYEPSLKFPDQILSGPQEAYYADRVRHFIRALKTDGLNPPGLSKPLQVLLETENGKGFWKWYFERGYPDIVNCVDVEKAGKETLYRFRLPHQQMDYRLAVLVDKSGTIMQIRSW